MNYRTILRYVTHVYAIKGPQGFWAFRTVSNTGGVFLYLESAGLYRGVRVVAWSTGGERARGRGGARRTAGLGGARAVEPTTSNSSSALFVDDLIFVLFFTVVLIFTYTRTRTSTPGGHHMCTCHFFPPRIKKACMLSW